MLHTATIESRSASAVDQVGAACSCGKPAGSLVLSFTASTDKYLVAIGCTDATQATLDELAVEDAARQREYDAEAEDEAPVAEPEAPALITVRLYSQTDRNGMVTWTRK